MKIKNKFSRAALFLLLSVLAVVFLVPILLVVLNSFKGKFDIVSAPFALPTAQTFIGLDNYINGAKAAGFFGAFIRSLWITVGSVAVIVLFSAMTAWFITRSKMKFCRVIYYALVFSMIVPFQMVMYTLTYVVGRIHFNNLLGIIFVYLGFGAGLSVFMISGFVRSIPLDIEQAAMIDGCTPITTFFEVILPILKPTLITVAILNAMWIWNDYLLPYLILGTDKNKTIPVAVQITMQGAYGAVDWGGFMAMLVLAIFPIVVFYLFCQKYIISGVLAGAVKG
ncbi:MAG: carbohydrate ABC transporter permease [Clostridia bacterium]|nr:carbohydrate ABC transporter permease [Clostridia bacterium]